MADRDAGVVGSARRRWERRLRSMLRHERQTVAMELAAALRHSRDGERETTTPDGDKSSQLRVRLGVLKEPEAQEAAVPVGYVAAGVPLVGAHCWPIPRPRPPIVAPSPSSCSALWKSRGRRRRRL